MTQRETTRSIFRLGDETLDGRPRSKVAIAAGLGASGLVDAALGLSGLARPVVLVSGFWRSGTTWLQECLVEGLEAKSIFEPLSPQEPRRRAALHDRVPWRRGRAAGLHPGLARRKLARLARARRCLQRAARGLLPVELPPQRCGSGPDGDRREGRPAPQQLGHVPPSLPRAGCPYPPTPVRRGGQPHRRGLALEFFARATRANGRHAACGSGA